MRPLLHSRKSIRSNGLRTERQIDLFRKREAAKREQAEREEVEQRVRHLKFDLVQRAVLFAMSLAVGTAVVVGVLGNQGLLKLALVATGLWGGTTVAVYRLRPESHTRNPP